MTANRKALLSLTVAGVLWGLTVPLTKVALDWLDPLTLSVARFALAAPALALLARHGLREALRPGVLGWGVVLYAGVFALQNIGVGLTSVSHAALVFGTVPAMVAGLGLVGGRGGSRVTWIGFGLALVGVALLTRPAGESSLLGDGLVLASAALSALFIAGQPSVLRGRDPIAVTAVQMAAGTLVLLPLAAVFEGPPAAAAAVEPMIAFGLLASAGSLLPFTLYAFAQSRVPAEVAGAFVNLEPLVGAAAGALAFGDPFGALQMTGVAAILLGLALSTNLEVRPSRSRAARRRSQLPPPADTRTGTGT